MIVTVSDSAVAGTRVDASGPALEERVRSLGWSLLERAIVPDESQQITRLLIDTADRGGADVILTTGGTGIALRDVTPEATRAAIERDIPGIPEVMRVEGRKHTHLAALSRAVAGTRKRTLILNLPGSPKGAVESFDSVSDLVAHVVDLLQGRTEHRPASKLNPTGERPTKV